jgi:hypothetical protein
MAHAIDLVTEWEFMALGMHLAGPPNWERRNHETNVRAFVSHYGACPMVCERVWWDLQTNEEEDGSINFPVHLLLALRFLKAYPKDDELCGFFGMSNGTMWKWRDLYVSKLATLLDTKVSQLSNSLLSLSCLLIFRVICPLYLQQSGRNGDAKTDITHTIQM